jgi:hypothetical protein
MRRHHHQADRQLDRDQVVELSARGFGGQGEQLPHRERLFFQTRPRGDPVPGHVPGRYLLLQDHEGVPHRLVQGETVAGVGAFRVVQQDQVQPLTSELLTATADLPAHVVRGETVPGHRLVLGEDTGVHSLGAGGRREVPRSSSLTQRPNSWMGVTYRSLALDMAFCQGVFGG